MMAKMRRFFYGLLCIIFVFEIFPFNVSAKTYVEDKDEKNNQIAVEARSALLIEPNSGGIIYEKNSHEKFAPASVTKIMTMLITMEKVDSGKIKLSDKVTVSENAKKMGGSSMILDTGEIRTVEELLKGVAIASGNDAAVALAEYVAGSQDSFVNLMNEKAKSLGMKDTTFKNCTGLSAEGHLTTAYDISIMSRELLKHPAILKYTGTYMETISEGRKTPIGLVNHNKLVRFFKGCDGLKTGFTDEAKYCISATAVRDGVRMLAVIMGAPSYKVRNRDASMLMNYGFSRYSSKKVVEKDMEMEKVVLGKKSDRYFSARAKNDFTVITDRGKSQNVVKKCMIDKDKKEYKKGENVGYCEIYLDGKLCGKVQLYCDRDVKRPGIWYNFKINLKDLFDSSI